MPRSTSGCSHSFSACVQVNESGSTLKAGKVVANAPLPIPVKKNLRAIDPSRGQRAILSTELRFQIGTDLNSAHNRSAPRKAAIERANATAIAAIENCQPLRGDRPDRAARTESMPNTATPKKKD